MNRHRRPQRGYALVMALLMMTLGSVFSAWLYTQVQSATAVTSNELAGARAMAAAESGLTYMKIALADAGLQTPLRPTRQDQALYELGHTLAAMQPAGAVIPPTSEVEPVIQVAAVTLEDGSTFSSRLELTPDREAIRLSVTGVKSQGSRTIGLLLKARPAHPLNCGFPLISRLNLSVDGNSTVWQWDPETSGSSGTAGVVIPFDSGDESGNALCFEGQDPQGVLFPQKYLDDALYSKLEAMKGSTLKKYVAGNKLDNVYIPANTNPTLNNADLKGIVYVEWPNSLTFTQNSQFNGTIIYQKKPADWPDASKNWPVIDVSRSASIKRDPQKAAAEMRQVFAKSGEISTRVDELLAMIDPWAIHASDTDWNPQEGKTSGKMDMTGSIHIRNFLKAAGEGKASPDTYVFHGTIVCEGWVDLRGNRQFCIDPQTAPASDEQLGIKFTVLNGGYWEQ